MRNEIQMEVRGKEGRAEQVAPIEALLKKVKKEKMLGTFMTHDSDF